MGTIDQVTLKKRRRRRRRRERHFEKKKEKKKKKKRTSCWKKKKEKKKEKEENLGRAFVEKFFSPSFPPNLGGKKMWARRENFFSSFPTFLFSFPKRTVKNSIFHPIFHPLYFHPKRTKPKGLFGYHLL